MNVIKPGLLRVFRYFTAIAMAYYAVVAVLSGLQTGQLINPGQVQLYLNLLTNIVLFGYLSWGWLQRKLKGWYLPVGLLAATVIPIFSSLIYLAEPQVKDLSLMIVRSWLLFPILLVPLVLIAWQYGFLYVMIFTVVTAIVELVVLYPVVTEVNIETLPILGLPLIRAFAFGTAGQIVAHLTEIQQAQSKALLRANYQLSQHAETLEQLAVSRERNRLARELHDTLAHTLSGQTVNLEAIKLMLDPDQDEIRRMLDRALENTRAGLSETRRALKDLRPLALEDLGLGIAIRNLAQEAAARAGFALLPEIAEDLPKLPPQVEQCFFRIAQESLENIVRHAGAGQVRLRLERDGRGVWLAISDDGAGADLERIDTTEKLGLQGMQERAAEVGGKLVVHSQPGKGTTVHFSYEGRDD
ncbi:MAG: sensor histidine kinase [Anaerolineales bacterium]|nr:sensor histidine kinase [Anaerolineales bacterium]